MAIDCGAPPSNQMQLDLPGFTDEGRQLMEEARMWAGRHYREFMWYKRRSAQASRDGYASPNLMLQLMRNEFRVSVPNAYAAPLARIAMEQDSSIRFRLARSKVDGWTEAVL